MSYFCFVKPGGGGLKWRGPNTEYPLYPPESGPDIKLSKIRTFSSNSSKESLKWSKESALDDAYTRLFKIKALRL